MFLMLLFPILSLRLSWNSPHRIPYFVANKAEAQFPTGIDVSSGRHSSHAPLLYRRSSRVEMSHVLFYRNGSCMLSTKDTTHILLAIAPIGEMAPGVPWNNRSKWFRCISAPVSERWHPSKTSHRGCLKKIWKYIDKCHRTRCHPSLDYGNTVQAFAGGIPVGCEFDPNSWSSYCPYFLWWGTRSVVQ